MGNRKRLGWAALALVALVAVARSGLSAESEGAEVVRSAAVGPAPAAPTPAVSTPEPTAVPVAVPVPPPPTPAPTPVPTPTPWKWTPFAYVGDLALIHPSQHVKIVGFHQASDAMNRDMSVAESTTAATVLPSRHRPTPPRSAADIVVRPGTQVRVPVSGIVKRAGTYNLYCKYPDAFVVISPDGHPELEVKMLHVTGLHVRAGDRVTAVKTVLADHATKFPFSSQIDAYSGVAWPHVHMEVTQLEHPNTTVEPGRGLAFGC